MLAKDVSRRFLTQDAQHSRIPGRLPIKWLTLYPEPRFNWLDVGCRQVARTRLRTLDRCLELLGYFRRLFWRRRSNHERLGYSTRFYPANIHKQAACNYRRIPLACFLYTQRFNAGVTSIQSHPHTEYLIAVGRWVFTLLSLSTAFEVATKL